MRVRASAWHRDGRTVESRVDCGKGRAESFGKLSGNLPVQDLALTHFRPHMKKLRHAFCVLFVAACLARAAEKEETESPLGDFAPTFDDLIQYVPKFTVKLGFRGIGGVKSSFGGHGTIPTDAFIGDPTGANQDREYHDGFVRPDSHTLVDPSGNGAPAQVTTTNTWSFTDASQATSGGLITLNNGSQSPNDGLMAMHSYTASTDDASFRKKDPGPAFGVELTAEREMGTLFKSRVRWGLIAGFSVNQIYATTKGDIAAKITTTTDYYDLHGQAAPAAGYVGPVSSLGAIDPSVLLGNEPVARTDQTTTGTMQNQWKLRGAYMTFRAGPTLFVPVTSRLSATVSAGAVLVYVGTTYDVQQSFKPETGDVMSNDVSDGASNFLPGYYADANLQYTMTENSGLYVGAVYQSSGKYEQTMTSSDGLSTYSTRVDLTSLEGLRAGVLFKF